MIRSTQDGPMLLLDTETTGVDTETCRIVTCCAGSVGGGVLPDLHTWLINPGVDIPAEATAVHGITTEHAAEHGHAPADALTAIGDVLRRANPAAPLVAFNAAYDLTLIDREMRRHLGHPLDLGGRPVIDPFVIDREMDRYRKGKRTLAALCEHYHVSLDAAHNCREDALAAGRLAWRLMRAFPQLAEMRLSDLHDAQVEWHAARQADFAAYLARSGKDPSGVDGAWPMRPLPPPAEEHAA